MEKTYSEEMILDILKERDFWREKIFSLARDPAFKRRALVIKEAENELKDLFL